jgi:Domain of unknown function (DUF4440)
MNDSFKTTFDKFVNALNTRDSDVLETIIADGFRFTGTAAQFQDKAERIRTVQTSPAFPTLKYRNIEFETFAETCLAYAEFQYENVEGDVLEFGRATFVFVKRMEAWKLVAQHNSHVKR